MFAKRRTAIKALTALALASACSLAFAAQVAGTVVNLSGPLMAKKSDGTVKVLALRSEVEQGDTLVSERNTYAQIKFIDNSEVTLKPNTTFKIEAFAYDEKKPDADNASFSLVKGGLRSITGLLGKRNKEKFALKTPTATIGIRGTTFVAEWVEPPTEGLAERQAYLFASSAGADGAPMPAAPLQLAQMSLPNQPGIPRGQTPGAPPLAPGLHVFVTDGLILMSNAGGSQQFAAGQFGYVRNTVSPPILVPANPGLKFTPPPTFSMNAGPNGANSGAKPSTVDCEVR